MFPCNSLISVAAWGWSTVDLEGADIVVVWRGRRRAYRDDAGYYIYAGPIHAELFIAVPMMHDMIFLNLRMKKEPGEPVSRKGCPIK